MAADVCLLLMQSLTGDCETTAPSMATPIAPIEEQQADPSNAVVEAVPTEIAPSVEAWEPQFGSTDWCANQEQRLITCLESVQERQRQSRIGSMAIPQPEPAETISFKKVREIPLAETVTPAFLPANVSSPFSSSPTTPVALQIPAPKRLVAAIPTVKVPQFSPPVTRRRPASGAQFYRQRELALQSGQLYTRLSPSEFVEEWSQAAEQPTYQDWTSLLAREGQAVAAGQGSNRLEVILGDSLGMWMPSDTLPRDRLWLNQSISGDTTAGVLGRLSAFANTRPTRIHLLAGVNDLKNGVPEATIAINIQTTVRQLQQQHPEAQIVVYSVFPTRWENITNDRVETLNRHLAAVAEETAVEYRNIYSQFQDAEGSMRVELTTDGLHLNTQGYDVWRQAMLVSAR